MLEQGGEWVGGAGVEKSSSWKGDVRELIRSGILELSFYTGRYDLFITRGRTRALIQVKT